MPDLIIPTIGASGYFDVQPPFDLLMAKGQIYTCQGIRKISDYLANSEDPKKVIYDKYGITTAHWIDDAAANMSIVSLQSDKGHWLYIPAKFINTYPLTNGIAYRSVMIGAALPPIPVTQDLTDLETSISNLIIDALGITPVVKLVETSAAVAVTDTKHIETQTARNAIATGRNTDYSRYANLLIQHQIALDKIQELESYILLNHVP